MSFYSDDEDDLGGMPSDSFAFPSSPPVPRSLRSIFSKSNTREKAKSKESGSKLFKTHTGSSLWRGSEEWSNIPGVVRIAFKHLFSRSKHASLNARNTGEIVQELLSRVENLTARLERAESENASMRRKLKKVYSTLDDKVGISAFEASAKAQARELKEIHDLCTALSNNGRNDAKVISEEVQKCRDGSKALKDALLKVESSVRGVITSKGVTDRMHASINDICKRYDDLEGQVKSAAQDLEASRAKAKSDQEAAFEDLRLSLSTMLTTKIHATQAHLDIQVQEASLGFEDAILRLIDERMKTFSESVENMGERIIRTIPKSPERKKNGKKHKSKKRPKPSKVERAKDTLMHRRRTRGSASRRSKALFDEFALGKSANKFCSVCSPSKQKDCTHADANVNADADADDARTKRYLSPTALRKRKLLRKMRAEQAR